MPQHVDPTLARLVAAQRAASRLRSVPPGVSRRSVLRGAGGVAALAALAACGTSAPSGSSSPSKEAVPVAKDRSDTEKELAWANWTLYLDYDETTKKYPSLEQFQKESGITVAYSEDIDDNDSYYGKVQGQLKRGQDIERDIITLTDWMAGRLIRSGWVQELDKANIPNAKNLLPALQDVEFDKGRKYSLTWQSGYAGIAWNKAKVPGGLKNVSDLWKPELKGRVEVLSEMRDTIGLILLEQGKDISADFSKDDFMAAVEELDKHVASGQIRQVKGNSYKEDLISGDALAVIGWSGDIFQINAENDDQWEFAIPEAGGILFSDNLMVPNGSPHKKNAERLMDFYYDPKNAATVAAYVNYICPVAGAQAEMEKLDPELAKSPFIFPTEEDLKKVKAFRPLSPEEERDFNAEFQTVIGN